MTIGEHIRKARKEMNLTQEQLANKIGMKRAVISKYENDLITPSAAQIKKISDVLETPIWMLYDEIPLSPEEEKALWRYRKGGKWNLPGLVDGATMDMEERREELLYNFNKLNEKGQNKAVEQVADLAKIPEYQKDSQ